MKLSSSQVSSISSWVHRNARPLDLALWRSRFEGGALTEVTEALSFYRNPDGGFGLALEPDNWNPDSTPNTTLFAVTTLEKTGLRDYSHPLFAGALEFFGTGPHFSPLQGWDFSVPGNDDHPHAPWWHYSRDTNHKENLGLSATIAAFILRAAPEEARVRLRALSLIQEVLIPALHGETPRGELFVTGFIALVSELKRLGLADDTELSYYEGRLRDWVNSTIERNPKNWKIYGVRPSRYIRDPESPYLEGNRDILEQELDFLVETLPADTVWPISWSWFDHNDLYPRAFAVCERWWRSYQAWETLDLLKRFGRLEA